VNCYDKKLSIINIVLSCTEHDAPELAIVVDDKVHGSFKVNPEGKVIVSLELVSKSCVGFNENIILEVDYTVVELAVIDTIDKAPGRG
jgi:hypothetical protein